MKKRFFIIAALFFLLTGCAINAGRVKDNSSGFSQKQKDEMFDAARAAIIESNSIDENTLVLEKSLQAGSVLLGTCASYDNNYKMDDFCRFELYIGAHNGENDVWCTPIWSGTQAEYPLFNDYSYAFAWKSYAGTDLLFVISPAGDYPGTYDAPYAESEWNGITPYDSMGTEPILLCDEEVLDGYPTWIFCTTVEDLPEDYELHYGDQVVTYSDLRAWLSNVDDYMPE